MAALEDTMNITLCGLFVLLLSQICFDAFSAVTVQYSVIHETTLNTRTCIDWPGLQCDNCESRPSENILAVY